MSTKAITPFEKRVRHAVRRLIESSTSEGVHRDMISATITRQYKVKVQDVQKALVALEKADTIRRCGMGHRYRLVDAIPTNTIATNYGAY